MIVGRRIRKTEVLSVRVSPGQREHIAAAAFQAGGTLSEFVRAAALQVARDNLYGPSRIPAEPTIEPAVREGLNERI
jgi:uncharacterized protein (DUF1778 family)